MVSSSSSASSSNAIFILSRKASGSLFMKSSTKSLSSDLELVGAGLFFSGKEATGFADLSGLGDEEVCFSSWP